MDVKEMPKQKFTKVQDIPENEESLNSQRIDVRNSLKSAIFAHSAIRKSVPEGIQMKFNRNLQRTSTLEREVDAPPIEMKELFSALTIKSNPTSYHAKQDNTKMNERTDRDIFTDTKRHSMMNLDFANMIKRKFVDHPHYKSHAAMKQSLEYQQKMASRRVMIRKELNITKLIILPDDAFKSIWSGIAMLLLLYACIVTPYRTAFSEEDPIGWIVVDSIIDILFLIDLILNFFYAYYDENEELVIDRKKIAIKYLKSWFIIDIIAILPINYMIPNQSKDYGGLSRLARLPRLYRLLKLTKVLRTIRVCREKNAWLGQVESVVPNLSVAGERLLAFIMVVLVIFHVTACLWYLLAQIEGLYPDSWVVRYGFQDSDNIKIYTACFYFTVTTITTVGYGDLSPGTTGERWFGILTMMIGVMSYSFAISSLSSMISTNDEKETQKTEALETLDNIDLECNLDTKLFLELRKTIALKFKQEDYFKDRDALVNLVPRKLKRKLNSAMHRRHVTRIDMFKNENEEFLNYLSTLLRPRKYQAEEVICREGEAIEEIYFLLHGNAEYVLPQFSDTPYMTISKDLHFGELEIVNSLLVNKTVHGKRIFTAKAQEECQILILSITDLFKLFHKYENQAIKVFEGSELRLEWTLAQKEKKKNGLRLREKKISQLFEQATPTEIGEIEGNITREDHDLSKQSSGSNTTIPRKNQRTKSPSNIYTQLIDKPNIDIHMDDGVIMEQNVKGLLSKHKVSDWNDVPESRGDDEGGGKFNLLKIISDCIKDNPDKTQVIFYIYIILY